MRKLCVLDVSSRKALFFQFPDQFFDFSVQFRILLSVFLDFFTGMDNGTVISSAETFAYFFQGQPGHLFGQIDSDHPGDGNPLRPFFFNQF